MQRKEICQSPKMRNSRSSTRTRVRVRAYWFANPKWAPCATGSAVMLSQSVCTANPIYFTSGS